MSFAMVLKMFSDCSLCFAILGMVEANFPVPLLIPAVIYAVSAGLATFFEERNRPVLRRLCALLPWVCLLFGANLLQFVLLAVPAAYCSLVILFGVLELEYYTYRKFLLRSMLLLGVGWFMVSVWNFCNMAVLEQPSMDVQVMIRYEAVHLLCGIVLLRQLRLGVGEYAAGGRRQMATMLAVAGTIALCTVLGEPFFRQGAWALVGAGMTVIAIPFVLLIEVVVWLAGLVPAKEKFEYMELKGRLDEIRTGMRRFTDVTEAVPAPEPLDIDRLVITLIVVVLSVVAVVILVKSFMKPRPKVFVAEDISRVPEAPKKKKKPLLSNRAKVRQAYRAFLRAEQDLGMKIASSDTSEDVLGRVHRTTNRDSADDLRNVYLAARYDDRHNISREQVEQAKRALKATRKKP